MTAKQRILALRLLKKQKKYPEHMKTLGVEVKNIEKPVEKSKKNINK